MQAISAKLYSLFAILLFFAAAGLRLSMLLFDLSAAATAIYYILLLSGMVFMCLIAYHAGRYKTAFRRGKKQLHSNAAFVAVIGFFVDFVHRCVNIYDSVDSGQYKSLKDFLPICFTAVFAIISCFYFYTVGLSYSSKSYDFKNLKLMHFAPLVWSIAQMFTVMQDAFVIKTDIDQTVKYIVLIFAACFFYRFSAEIESNQPTKPSTVFCSQGFVYYSAMLLANRAFLVCSKQAPINSDDSVMALSMVLIAIYVLVFEKSISNNAVAGEA